MRIDFGYSRTSVLNIEKRIKYAESVSLGKYVIALLLNGKSAYEGLNFRRGMGLMVFQNLIHQILSIVHSINIYVCGNPL